MSESVLAGSGSMPLLYGSGAIVANTEHVVSGNGSLPALFGEGSAKVFSFAERSSYLELRDDELMAGCLFFEKGPGLITMIGCKKARRIVAADAGNSRKLSILGATSRLDGAVIAMTANAINIFVYLRHPDTGIRYFSVFENTVSLDPVFQETLDAAEPHGWITLQENAEIIAHPEKVSRAVIRRTTAPFARIGTAMCSAHAASAKWVRARLLEGAGDG